MLKLPAAVGMFLAFALSTIAAVGCVKYAGGAWPGSLMAYSCVRRRAISASSCLPPCRPGGRTPRYPVTAISSTAGARPVRAVRAAERGYDSRDQCGEATTSARFVGSNATSSSSDGTGATAHARRGVSARPYNISPVETYRQFPPPYFPELVGHIDASARTIADRDHRATRRAVHGRLHVVLGRGQQYAPHLGRQRLELSWALRSLYAGLEQRGFPSENAAAHRRWPGNYEALRTRIVTVVARDFITLGIAADERHTWPVRPPAPRARGASTQRNTGTPGHGEGSSAVSARRRFASPQARSRALASC